MRLILILCMFYTSAIQAAEYTSVDSIQFEIKSENITEKLERTMKNPEPLLLRFRPEGAVITRKEVSSNSMSFVATKNVLFISKSVNVKTQLDIQENSLGCGPEMVGYNFVLSVDGSDSFVTNNVDHLEAKLCVKIFNNQKIVGTVRGKIFKGHNFSRALGPVAINMIEAQVAPLIRALSEEIKLMK